MDAQVLAYEKTIEDKQAAWLKQKEGK